MTPRRIFLFGLPWAVIIGVGAGIVTAPEATTIPSATSTSHNVERGGGPPMTTSGRFPLTKCDKLLLRARSSLPGTSAWTFG